MSGDLHSKLHGVVSFRLDRMVLALPVETLREVVPIARLHHPPELPTFVHGILNLGGEALPVLRLDRLLGVPECEYGLDASILVMRGEPPLGLLVSHVDAVRAVQPQDVLDVPSEQSLNGCITALLAGPGGDSHLLSWETLILAEERLRIAEFAERAAARLAGLLERAS